MSIQTEQAQVFHSLHKAGDPLILFNIWNPGSAATVAASGVLGHLQREAGLLRLPLALMMAKTYPLN